MYVFDRNPTLAMKSMTLEEAQSGRKPSINHFKVFGCLSHVHVPDSKKVKLDNESLKCILLGVGQESKTYRLFDPISQKIIVSQDVVFEEDQHQNQDNSHEQAILAKGSEANEDIGNNEYNDSDSLETRDITNEAVQFKRDKLKDHQFG